MMELENAGRTRRDFNLEMALEASKETTLSGNIHEKVVCVSNAEITLQEVCHLCGKILPLLNQSECDDSSVETIICNCANTVGFFVDNESEAANKRDSGFHTLKRGEKEQVDTGQQIESAMSSASSADSALSMGSNDDEEKTSNDKNEITTVPSIVIDECNNIAEKDDDKFEYSEAENTHHGNGKIKESPELLAKKLFTFDGYKRTDVAKKIGKNTDYSCEAGHAYLKHFDFSNYSLVDAYREFLSRFALLGETQERERILSYFSHRYVTCNPDFLDQEPDSVHTLICAITLLNTDLHGNLGFSGRKKMTCKQFSTNLSGLMSNQSDYPKELLLYLYTSVKKNPLPWGGNEPRNKVPRSTSMRQNTEPNSRTTPTKIVNRSMSTRSPFKSSKASSIDSSRAGLGRSAKLKPHSHNQGLLWSKALLDSDRKKLPIGKRKWKVYSVTLQNLGLHVAKRGSTEAKTINIHHCFAEESSNDSKRQHVFRVTLADSSVTLYQASSEKEARKWIRDINKTAALLSAAPLCSPVGSQLVFRKALLPSAPSTLPPVNQLSKLQDLLKEHEEDLAETEKLAIAEKSPNEQKKQYYGDKIEYLNYEIKKYKHYVKTVQVILRTSSTMSDDCKSNLENSDNGSLVSVTPSEPPMASPSLMTSSDNFIFPASSDKSDSESDVVFGSPAHLLSPQHRTFALSPTSSLPNLSPIMESPTKELISHNSGLGSLRRRKRMQMYESSLNGTVNNDGIPELKNSNNSNQKSIPKQSNVASKVPIERQSTPLQTVSSSHSDKKHLWKHEKTKEFSTNDVGISKNLFPVKRFQMRIAEMNQADFTGKQNRNLTPSSYPQQHDYVNEMISHVSDDAPFTDKVPFCPNFNLIENKTLSRVKGRREKKGIERYSYMQAISPPEES